MRCSAGGCDEGVAELASLMWTSDEPGAGSAVSAAARLEETCSKLPSSLGTVPVSAWLGLGLGLGLVLELGFGLRSGLGLELGLGLGLGLG